MKDKPLKVVFDTGNIPVVALTKSKVKKFKLPLELAAMSREELYGYIDKLVSQVASYQDVIEYSEGKSKNWQH